MNCPACGKRGARRGVTAQLIQPQEKTRRARVCSTCAKGGTLLVFGIHGTPAPVPSDPGLVQFIADLMSALRKVEKLAMVADAQSKESGGALNVDSSWCEGRAEGLRSAANVLKAAMGKERLT